MEKLESLLLENPSQILQNTFENIRKENSFSVEAFQKILDEKGQDFFWYIWWNDNRFYINRFNGKFLKQLITTTNRNQSKVIKENKKLFLYFFAYLESTFTVYQPLIKAYAGDKLEIRDITIFCLYGNLCRMADEIGVLITNGYILGALQRVGNATLFLYHS